MWDITKILDLSMRLIEIYGQYDIFSNYMTISIFGNSLLRFYIHNDLIIKEFNLDFKKGFLEAELKGFSLPDEIEETYGISLAEEIENYTPDIWLNKSFIANLMKKYPKAFRIYNKLKETADQFVKNYGLNAEIITYYDGYTCIKITEDI